MPVFSPGVAESDVLRSALAVALGNDVRFRWSLRQWMPTRHVLRQ